MKRLIGAMVVCGLAGAATLLAPQEAPAQDVPDGAATAQVAPAQNLEDVRPASSALRRLTITNALGAVAHLWPTVKHNAPARSAGALYFGGTPPLLYHAGGRIMPIVRIYTIFWAPPTLQNGGTTSMPASYQNLQNQFAADYPGHGIANISTQYYQVIGGRATYIRNAGSFGGSYVDTSPYPASGCTDSVTPGNCITDAQIQAEITKVMGLNGWKGGLTNIFLLYTSPGEGSCFDSTSTDCSYTQYCAYHGFISTSPSVIYANIPYGSPLFCQLPGVSSPNNNSAADTALTAVSHEVTEAVTDPLLNAWFTSDGFEIGDLCAYDYGTTQTWDSGNANQAWNGHFYELQTEFDNHAYSLGGGCVQVGPYESAPSSGL